MVETERNSLVATFILAGLALIGALVNSIGLLIDSLEWKSYHCFITVKKGEIANPPVIPDECGNNFNLLLPFLLLVSLVLTVIGIVQVAKRSKAASYFILAFNLFLLMLILLLSFTQGNIRLKPDSFIINMILALAYLPVIIALGLKFRDRPKSTKH